MTVITPKRKKQRRKIAVAAIVLGVIIFAFIWEAAHHGRDGRYPPRDFLETVQHELDEAYWIIPRFLTTNRYSRPGHRIREVNAVVVHYVANPGTTAEQNRNFFESLSDGRGVFASSNFIIGLEGEVLQLIPVYEIAYASNHRNSDTVSIEICHPDESGSFTSYTYASMVRLTAHLVYHFGLTADDIIRHYDVNGKLCPRYFVVNEDAWEAFRADVAEAVGNNRGIVS